MWSFIKVFPTHKMWSKCEVKLHNVSLAYAVEQKLSFSAHINPFMHNVVKWPNMLYFTTLCMKGLKDILEEHLKLQAIWDAFRDLVPFEQFKKREIHLWSSVTSKVTLLHGCFSRYLNCTSDTKLRKVSHFYK